jgi:single-stranded-DNA-specific exonuclease
MINTNKLPKPVIQERITDKAIYDAALEAGLSELQAKIIANRQLPKGTDIHGFINPSLEKMPKISLLKDIKIAGERIAEAIINEEVIGLVCDFDVDGTSSAAVMYKALVDLFKMPAYKVKVYISNRMKEGYGFSDQVLDRILDTDPIPSLLITADQGSANGAQVTRYLDYMKSKKKKGDVIVSDHHEIPKSGGPHDAIAFVNPQQKDDQYPDKTICGCTVALFLMASARNELIKSGHLNAQETSLRDLIAYSTAATIADCVSMASQTNRAIVKQGLQEINDGKLPAWKQMKQFVRDEKEPIKEDTIGFGLGPRINACSRTGGDGLNAVRYYLSDNDQDAERYLEYLHVDNNIRKDIEQKLLKEATRQAISLTEQGHRSIVFFLKDGHHGIHGIVASRICERFGRPVIALSPKDVEQIEITQEEAEVLLGTSLKNQKIKDYYDLPDNAYISVDIPKKQKQKPKFFHNKIITIGGSARSIDGLGDDQKGMLSILECLIETQDKYNVFNGFGGHTMAAGMNLPYENIETLRKGVEEAVCARVKQNEVYPKVWSDGQLPRDKKIDLNLVDELNQLEPYGRQFDYPSFTVRGKIIEKEIRGEKKDTGLFKLMINKNIYKGIWFKFTSNAMHNHVTINKEYDLVIQVKENYFKGEKQCQIQILHAQPV